MNGRDPAKRIPKSMGTDTKLFGKYTLTDVAVALCPGVVVVLIMQVTVPASVTLAGYPVRTLALPFASVAVAFGALFVYLTPAYTTSLAYLGTAFGYYRRPSQYAHEQAKVHTQIERVYPNRGAVKRVDGAFVGAVEVQPPTMALATDAEWAQKAEAFRDFCNTVIEFPVQVFSTTESFPVDEYLTHYEQRLSDPDVKGNPRLEALIEQYIEWYAADLADRQMTIREHYIIVSVSPEEVQFERTSALQKLAARPWLGLPVRMLWAPREAEQREAMVETLATRLQQVEAGIRGIDGCEARQLTPEDVVELVGRYWAGNPPEYGDLKQVLRTTPLIGRQA